MSERIRRTKLEALKSVHRPGEENAKDIQDVTRRSVLETVGKGWSLAAAPVLGGFALAGEVQNYKNERRNAESRESERAAREALLEHLARSPRLRAAVNEFLDDFQREMPAVLRESDKDRVDGKPCAEFFFDHLFDDVPSDEVPDIREELRLVMAGLPATESRYDNSRVNAETGARYRIQVLESTWLDAGYTEADMSGAPAQIELMRSFIRDADRMLNWQEDAPDPGDPSEWTGAQDSLNIITRQYFGGDEVQMRKLFLLPCIVTRHQAGLGTIRNFIRYVAAVPKQNVQAFDVFYHFATEVGNLPDDSDKRDNGLTHFNAHESINFFARSLAFALLLDSIRRQRRGG